MDTYSSGELRGIRLATDPDGTDSFIRSDIQPEIY